MHRSTRLVSQALVVAALLAAACDTPTASHTDDTLTVLGSAGAAPAYIEMSSSGSVDSSWLTGAPSSITIRMYALWISQNADCSAPVLVQNYGSLGEDKDFYQHPVLFAGSPANGTYPCVMFQMSDVLRMKPATSFGACVAGTEYSGDIYRDGESDWKDPQLNPITGSGTDASPVDDHVTIFFAHDTAAVLARGISTNQLVHLESAMVVPGQSTFYMDASHAVVTDGVECGLEPPRTSFR